MAWQNAQFYSNFCKVMKDIGGQCCRIQILATSCNEMNWRGRVDGCLKRDRLLFQWQPNLHVR